MSDTINIRSFAQKVLSKWHFFLVSLLIVGPAALVYLKFADDIYKVRASILLGSNEPNKAKQEKFLKGMELLTTETDIEDEIGILKSLSLAEQTVKKLDFGVSYFTTENFKRVEVYGRNDYPFVIELDSAVDQVVNCPVTIKRTSANSFSVHAKTSEAETYNFRANRPGGRVAGVDIHAQGIVNKPFESSHLKFRIRFSKDARISDPTEYSFTINNLTSVAEAYRENLDVKPLTRESSIVEINTRSKVPAKEIRFVNTLLDVYLANEVDKKNQLGLKTIHFIENELSSVSDELKSAEQNLEAFRSHSNVMDIQTTATNLAKNLDKLESERSVLELKLRYYRYLAGSLNSDNDMDNISTPSTYGLEDPLLNNLLIELSRLRQERIGLGYSTKEGNPTTQVIDLKIANSKKALRENVNNFIGATSAALDDLNKKIGGINHSVQSLPGTERQMVSIQRKFDLNENVYNYLLEKKAEAGMAIATNMVDKTVVDRARQIGNGPVFPSAKLILGIALLLIMAGGVGSIIINDVFHDPIITASDVESSTRIPILGSITHGSRKERSLGMASNFRSALAESFRSLSVNIQYLTSNIDTHVVGVTSTIEREGKTFCSVNLAMAIAQSGRRTVLIDADLRKPKVADAFRIKARKGLSNFLGSNCTIGEIISNTPLRDLDVITSGPLPTNPIKLIGSRKMEVLIEKLKETYQTIIIDSSPIGYVSEYIILMKYTNTNIYVVRSNYTNRYHLEKINNLYDNEKVQNISIVLNDAKGYNGYAYGYK